MDDAFLSALAGLPSGYSRGSYRGGQWGVTVERSSDGRRLKLFGEALGDSDHVSFNLYHVGGRPRLKPCEMPKDKVISFVLGYKPLQDL
ncbi:MAG: hypothetical protein CME85_01265 [Henriciella sp.]|nr:hypothetical protein [Henriciella sp.]MBK74105.1 hypothetical protein [Henriciella sp.]